MESTGTKGNCLTHDGDACAKGGSMGEYFGDSWEICSSVLFPVTYFGDCWVTSYGNGTNGGAEYNIFSGIRSIMHKFLIPFNNPHPPSFSPSSPQRENIGFKEKTRN